MTSSIVTATDGDLARAIASGAETAEAAETELYRRFASRVRLYGRRHLRDEEAAGDLMQQVLLLTIEKLREGAVRDLDMIGSFILGTSRMMTVNLKRRDRRREVLIERLPHDPPALAETRARDDRGLERCLSALAERERTIVLLTFYSDRSSREISHTLGISEGNVRVIRSRAIDRLRVCMDAAGRAS